MAHNDVEAAEKYFNEGLALASQIPIPERIAGLTANLGLAARKRGDTSLARQYLQNALELAKELGSHHLESRIRIWLVPLLSPFEARFCLEKARILAEENGLTSLLAEIRELELKLSNP